MKRDSVTYRLGTSGERDILSTLDKIKQAGEGSAQGLGRAFDRDLRVAEAAVERVEKRAKALLAMGGGGVQRRIAETTGIASAEFGNTKSAEASMAVFIRQQDELAQARQRLLAQADPLVAAQQRYNAVMTQAVALDRQGALQAGELSRIHAAAKAELDQYSVAMGGATKNANLQRMGFQQLSYQVADVGASYASGISPMIIFAQQGTQVIQSVALMSSGTSKLAAFLTGPWGLAVMGGVSVLGIFATSLLRSEKAAEKATDKIDFQKMSTEELTKAINDQLAAQEKSIANTYAAAEAARVEAAENVNTAKTRREKTKTILEEAIAYEKLYTSSLRDKLGAEGAAGFDAAAAGAQSRVDALQADIDKQDANIAGLEKLLRGALVPIVRREIEAGNDPTAAAKLEAEKAEARLDKQYRDGLITKEKYRLELDKIADREAKAVAAAQKRQSGSKPDNSLDAAVGLSLNAVAQQYIGRNEDNRTDAKVLSDFFKAANGTQIDPKITAWCAAFVNAVLATEGLPGTGSLAARSFLDYGKSVDSPQKGDIVVLKRGSNPDKGHVGFFDGFDKDGNPVLISGNAGGGKAVTRQSFSKGDVLGYRRVGSPGDMLQQAEERRLKAEQELQRQLEQNTRSVRALVEAGDPYAAIANRLKDELAEIDRLAAVPKEQGGIGSEQADILRGQARGRADQARTDLFNDSFDKAFEETAKKLEARREFLAQLTSDQAAQNRLLDLEFQLIGASNDERERALADLALKEDLLARGIDLNSVEAQAILQGNDALEERLLVLSQQQQQWEEFRRIGENAIDTLFDPDNWNDWGELGKKIIRDLIRELLVLAAINPLKNALFGSGLPVIGSLFGGGPANLLAGTPFGNAIGTEFSGGGWRRVGEFGEELVKLPQGSKVLNASRTRQLDRAGGAGMRAPSIFNFNAPGADAAALARLEQAVRELDRSLERRAIDATTDLNQRTFGAAFAV